MKKLKCIIAALAIGASLMGFGATSRTVRYLDNYHQLQAVAGQDGLFYVRNNMNAPNGENEWAIYAWDTPLRAWRMITRQSVLNMPAKYDLSQYLSKALYTADITSFKQAVNDASVRLRNSEANITSLQEADAAITAALNNLVSELGTVVGAVDSTTNQVNELSQSLAQTTESVNSLATEVNTAKEDISGLKDRTTAVEEGLAALPDTFNQKDTELRGYTDSKVADLKVDIITNTAVRMKTTLGVATNYSNQVKVEALAAASGDAASKDAALAETLRGEIDTAKSEAIVSAVTSANSYTDGKGYLTAADAADTYQPKGPYLVPEDIEGKANKSLLFRDGKFWNELSTGASHSRFFNELGGGGVQFENTDTGHKSAFAVNNGEEGIYGQAYAIRRIDGKSVGARITLTDHGAFYTVTNTYKWVEGDDEIIARRDLAAYQPKGEYLTAPDIAGKANAEDVYTKTDVYTKAEADGKFLTEHIDISGKLDIDVAENTYQPKGNYLTEHQSLDSCVKKDDIFTNGLFKTTYTDNNGSESTLWNETTGGGSLMIDKVSGVKAAMSVNKGSEGPGDTPSGLYGQIYAVKKVNGKSTGARLSISDAGIYYTVTNTYNWTAEDEVATKKDFAAYQPKGEYVVKGDALELPLKVKRGDKVYLIDVVDNEGDLTLRVDAAPAE